MMILPKLFLALVLTCCSAGFASAQLGSYVNDFNAPVFARRTNVTSLNLARKIFPDAKIDATEQNTLLAASKIPLRVLSGITPAEKIKADGMEGNLTVRVEDFIESQSGNEKLLWLFLQAVGEKYKAYSYAGQHILAVYRVGRETAELIDAVIVKQDDYTHFVERNAPIANTRKLFITPHREAVFIETRATTNGGVTGYSLVDLRDGKINVILREFDIWSDQQCNYFIWERAGIRLLKRPVSGYRPIEIFLITEKGDGSSSRPVVQWRRRFRYLFEWDVGIQSYKIVGGSGKKRRAALDSYNPCNESE